MNAAGDRLRAVVLGTGHLGSRHAQRLASSPGFRLAAVHDRDGMRAARVAAELGCPSLDAAAAIDAAQVVVVATSTSSHFEMARAALDAGKPVLVEKPITGNLEQAEILVDLAESRGVVLQVGQVERFNPALRGLLGKLPAPYFVESHRLAPLVPRNLDIDVVQDLMVHDLDLALAFVGEEPASVDAVGVRVLSDRTDIANARLRFPGGAVANLTASRVSLDRVRKFRMFLPGTYVSADCAVGTGSVYRLRDGRESVLREAIAGGRPVDMTEVLERRVETGEGDALGAEHEAFRLAVLGREHTGVSGRTALGTLRALLAVERAIDEGGKGA